jgi:hypothetical protein
MTWLILSLAVAAVIAVVAVAYTQGRSASLRRRFGSEYDRAIEEHGGRREAEAGLRDIARRRAELDVQDLPAPVRRRYTVRWRDVQLRFVDEPAAAVRQAESLVVEVMRERGYPTDAEEGAAMLSVDYPDHVADYRAARSVDRSGGSLAAGTDALREAFVRFRAMFDELLGEAADEPDAPTGPAPDRAGYGVVVADERKADLDRRVEARRDPEGAAS